MYTKEQASKLRIKFWTSFGQYMKPVTGAEGEPVNWLNYKTGIKHVYFRMDADRQQAVISIEIKNPLDAERAYYYDQFISLKLLLEEETGYKWNWEQNTTDENGKPVSRISQTLNNVNLMNEADWPAIIAFLKPRIIALDKFWLLVKDGFDQPAI
ncbi:MAG: DUF4268 domain-containing protein [Ferruginibacter sp.]